MTFFQPQFIALQTKGAPGLEVWRVCSRSIPAPMWLQEALPAFREEEDMQITALPGKGDGPVTSVEKQSQFDNRIIWIVVKRDIGKD